MDTTGQKLEMFRVLFDKYKIVFGIILSICACISGVVLFMGQSNDKPQESIRFLNEQEIASVQGINEQKLDSDKLVVDIAGQVKNPGVIEVHDGMSVLEVVEQAGGFTDKADQFYIQKNINLAELVKDRQKIYIPMIGENEIITGEGNTSGSTSGTSTLININTASKTELETLSGVGPATADKIIAARPYKKIDDIKKVPGIGDATFEKLKNSIKV